MTTKTELTQDSKQWVAQVTHVLGWTSRGLESSANEKLSLGDVRVSFPGADIATGRTRRQRTRALVIPREHGAWGLLLVPMVTGAGVGFRESSHVVPVMLLLLAALALFWLRTPVGSFLGTSALRVQTRDERRTVALAIAWLGAVAALALGALLWSWQNPLLWLIGAVAGTAFIAQALLKKLGRRMRMLSEIVGTIGLTASAPAAYYVITGKFGVTACAVWLANLIFAGDQIHYVQLRIHTARIEGFRAKLKHGWAFAAGQFLMTGALTMACLLRLIPPIASLAFSPILFRGWFYFIQKPAPLAVRKLGWSELSHAVAFCILFIATFALTK